MNAIKFKNNRLYYLDQTKLPEKELWKECATFSDGWEAIKKLQVRGAPLIGVFAAYCLYIWSKGFSLSKPEFMRRFTRAVDELISCRPTAMNLAWALQRVVGVAQENSEKSVDQIRKAILKEARAIHWEDIILCARIGQYGNELIEEGDTILTHCNAGALATSGEGTALAVIYKAHDSGKKIKVYADETRPLLQGARLTSWELSKHRVNCTLICDNMAASLMAQGLIDKVIVGADRIAANGDVANKIGTYSLAVNASYHKIPFYVAAPFSTFDLSLKDGKDIPIEERDADEVRIVMGKVVIAPAQINVYNPAFDVTCADLVTAIITDKGIIYPPFKQNIKKLLGE
jgi:methylthioribose-1-phosphate isomerase